MNSRFGVWKVTTPDGWCFLAQEGSPEGSVGYSGSKEIAEKELVSFRQDYPNINYEVRKHHDDCMENHRSLCCKPKEVQK